MDVRQRFVARGAAWFGLIVVMVAVVVLAVQQPATSDRASVAAHATPAPAATATGEPPGLLTRAGTLTWGGDATIGAPFLFADPAHPTVADGIMAEIMAAIAARLHLTLRFVQTPFTTFPRALHNRTIDLFADDVIPGDLPAGIAIYSAPFLMTSDEIVVRAGDTRFGTLKSLEGHTVAVVAGDRAATDVTNDSAIAAQVYQHFLPFEALAAGMVDAVVVSAPLARWFGAMDPQHRFTVLPLDLRPAPMAIALPISFAGAPLLQAQISWALQTMRCDGGLKGILARWGLTTQLQQWLALPAAGTCPAGAKP